MPKQHILEAFLTYAPQGMKASAIRRIAIAYNTPIIIKYPFWRMTAANSKATYACINLGQAVCPREIEKQSVCIDVDIGEVLQELL